VAVYIELTTEPFTDSFNKVKNNRSSGAGRTKVRRPLRGIEIKDDTYAYIKLIRPDGTEISLFDSSDPSGTSEEYSNFILQTVEEQRMERHQIVETFGDTYLFLFGESPRLLNVSAILVNTLDFNWKAEFIANYDKYLRGTKCLEEGARCYLFYDQNVIEGYILNATLSESSETPYIVPIRFQFFVTNASNISMIGFDSAMYPIRDSALIPKGIDLRKKLSEDDLKELFNYQLDYRYNPNKKALSRSEPIRGFISDNTDEYTTPPRSDYNFGEILDMTFRELQDLKEDLDAAIAKVAESLWCRSKVCSEPFFAE